MKYILLNLPNPSNKNVHRGYAGGFGTLGSNTRKSLFPIFLLYAASAMEKVGCTYKVLDAQAMKYKTSDILDCIKKNEADILISWISIVSLNDDLILLNKIKKENPSICIIALGTILNVITPEKILFNGVDLIIRGTYPYYNLLLNMCNIFMNNPIKQNTFDMVNGGVYVKDGKTINSILKPLKENLNELSNKVYLSLNIDKYVDDFKDINGISIKCIPIVTGVGCPYQCIYCPYPIGYGKEIINKSVENIIAEIEFLKNNFNIKGFLFRDQLFTRDPERVKKLCDKLIKRDLRIKWFVEARTDQISKEIISKMKEAGCFRIHYGVETGDIEILKKVGKYGLNIEKIKGTFQMTKDANILVQAHYIIGLPGEDNKSLKNSLKSLYLLDPDEINISIITPYPGTKFSEIAEKKGWIINYNLDDYTGFNAVMRTEELTIKQLNLARKEMLFKFIIFKLVKDKNYRKKFIRHLLRFAYKNFSNKIKYVKEFV